MNIQQSFMQWFNGSKRTGIMKRKQIANHTKKLNVGNTVTGDTSIDTDRDPS